MKSILAIDIGNTSVTLAFFQGKKIVRRLEILSEQSVLALRQDLRKACARFKSAEEVAVCSVVPGILKIAEPLLKKQFRSVWIAGKNLPIPITNRYKNPRQVGKDRLVGAYAAARLYRTPCIIIDLGTAITLDIVSKRREYLGGIIVPGIKLSADTLFQKAALLPRVTIKKPCQLIGKDTRTSILSGIFYGYGEMLKGLIELTRRQVRAKPYVIITGGLAGLMRRYIRSRIDVVDQDLVLKGLRLLSLEKTARG